MLPASGHRRIRSRAFAVLAIGLGLLIHATAGAPILPRSVVKSFFVATSGNTSTNAFASDTEVLLTYTAGLAGTASGAGASTALYLYDTTGEPLTSGTGQVVCAPCLVQSGGSMPRRNRISIDDLIAARGGFGAGMSKQGFLVLDTNDEADHLVARVRIRTTTGTAGQPTVASIRPRNVLEDCHAIGDEPRLVVLTDLDGITDWNVGDWAIYNGTYMGGIGGVPAGGGATLELYLFDENGSPSGNPVCAPCTYPLDGDPMTATPRNVELRFPPAPTASDEGFAVIRVAGTDPGAVVLEETSVDSIPGATPTLAVVASRNLELLPPDASTVSVAEPDARGAALALRASPNPSDGEMTFAFELARATSIDLEVFDTTGRRVATVTSGTRVAGRHELRWNRRDAAGGTLPAGLYYGRLRAGDGSRITRWVFLPE